MKTRVRPCLIALALLSTFSFRPATLFAQPAPTLSISLLSPALAELSWSNNLTGWQLMTATNLSAPANWQLVPDTPFPLGNALVVFELITNNSRFFRLQSGGGGGGGGDGDCTFAATPQVISPGGSTTLSWQPVTNTTYVLTPGPGTVTGSNYVVSPGVTTVYTLVSSNLAGVTFCSATVTVATAACDFASASSWNCTLTFSYITNPAAGNYSFVLEQQGNLTFHLTPSLVSGDTATFTGSVGGSTSINDSEEDSAVTPPNDFTTVIGSGVPDSSSVVHLHVNCRTGTYSFDVTPTVHAFWTQGNGSQDLLTTIGSVFVNNRALPASFVPLASAGTESLPAHSVAWTGGGDFYLPGGLGSAMFASGIVTETTAGAVHVNWSFVPTP